jgi:TetR/AcrR family transcriptional regulator, transcriptional repressor for nem operon
MRKSNEEAAKTRKTIVATAANELRRSGIAEASVADIMAAAGLTSGGFYRHFESKDQLVAEALEKAGDQLTDGLRKVAESGSCDDVVNAYIGATYKELTEVPSCPFASLGSEIARSGPAARETATKLMEEMFTLFGSGPAGTKATRRKGMAAFATLVGAMTLARISTDKEMAQEILDVARQKLHKAG